MISSSLPILRITPVIFQITIYNEEAAVVPKGGFQKERPCVRHRHTGHPATTASNESIGARVNLKIPMSHYVWYRLGSNDIQLLFFAMTKFFFGFFKPS